MQIRFDVPADPAYAARVTRVLSDVYLRKYRLIGLVLITFGLIGLALPLPDGSSGYDADPIFYTVITVGVLSLLFPYGARYAARRRLDGLAVDGSYDITDRVVRMRSGTESGTLPWADVTKVTESGGFWVLFTGRTPYTVVPQEFMSAEQQQTLRDFVASLGQFDGPSTVEPRSGGAGG